MEEPLRRAYLDALGIPLWVPRAPGEAGTPRAEDRVGGAHPVDGGAAGPAEGGRKRPFFPAFLVNWARKSLVKAGRGW